MCAIRTLTANSILPPTEKYIAVAIVPGPASIGIAKGETPTLSAASLGNVPSDGQTGYQLKVGNAFY